MFLNKMNENSFLKIEYGEGNRPMCQFWLKEPIDAGILGKVERIDMRLADDDSIYHVWTVSKEQGRVYYKFVRNKVPMEVQKQIGETVADALDYAILKTRENREGGTERKPSGQLRESVRKIVSEYLKTHLLK